MLTEEQIRLAEETAKELDEKEAARWRECKHPEAHRSDWHDGAVLCEACDCLIAQDGKAIEPPILLFGSGKRKEAKLEALLESARPSTGGLDDFFARWEHRAKTASRLASALHWESLWKGDWTQYRELKSEARTIRQMLAELRKLAS